MAEVEWQPLPPLWPEPAVWTDVGELMLLVFTQDGVPTWEVSRNAKAGSSRDELIANGTADTFEAAKAAALCEARARSTESGILTQSVMENSILCREKRSRCSTEHAAERTVWRIHALRAVMVLRCGAGTTDQPCVILLPPKQGSLGGVPVMDWPSVRGN